MKKIILFAMFLTLSATSFSQPNTETPKVKADYLQKNKNQKTAAWILVGGGAALIVTGSIVWANDINKAAETDPFEGIAAIYTSTSGYWIVAAGLVAAAGSIPLFIAAARNKRKAMSMSFKNETVPLLQDGSFVNRSVPSLTLKISL